MAPSPSQPSGTDLICAHFTLGGLDRPVALEERAAAVAEAGFRWLGWLGDAYAAERQAGRTDADIQAILGYYGVGVAEIEFLYGWAGASDEPVDNVEFKLTSVRWQDQEERLFHLADVVGARHLNCGDIGFGGPLLPLDDIAERFAGICDRAAEHGLKVGIEFLPWTEIPDAARAWEIARLAGRKNGGILIDAWHYFRGNPDPAVLEKIPPEQVILIQLDDAGPAEGEPWEDTSLRRRFPGEGEFDLVGFIQLLDGLGIDAPLSIEVMSEELATRSPSEATRRAYDTTTALLAKARG